MKLSAPRVEMKDLIGIVLFSRVLIFMIAIVSSCVIPRWLPDLCGVDVPEVNIPVFGLFAKWDSFYYFDIADGGYYGKADFWSFRPLYPLVLYLLGSPLAGFLEKNESFLMAGVFWNIFAFTLATIYLYRLTLLLLDQESAYYTVLFLSIFPGAIFFTAIYPESTYLLLVVASFFYLETDRIPIAVLLATLAGFTRPEGFLVFIPFACKVFTLKGNERLKSLLGSIAIALTLPAFMLYSYIITGDPYISFEVERNWPKLTLWDMLTHMRAREIIDHLTGIYSISTIVIVIAVLSVVMYFFHFLVARWSSSITIESAWHDKRIPYYFLAVALLGVFLYQADRASFARCASTLFPILWSNALWVKRKTLRVYTLLFLYAALMTLGTSFFVNWYHFV